MVDILRDVEVIENAVIAFEEGASDERRAAIFLLQKLLQEKRKILDDFEQFCDKY
jgi:hypothetical protein